MSFVALGSGLPLLAAVLNPADDRYSHGANDQDGHSDAGQNIKPIHGHRF